MKISKKLTAVISAMLIFAMSAVTVFADTYFVYDDYKFTRNGNNITLCEYLGSESVVNIPQSILGDTVTEIGKDCFINNAEITSVTIPNTVTRIKSYAFSSAENLETVEFSTACEYLEVCAFQGTGIKSLNLSNTTVINIYDQVFYSCKNLESVILPESAEHIGNNCFRNCPNLEYIYIPEAVTSIGANAFKDSGNVTIRGKAGSFAQTYAEENGIKFEATNPCALGDVNMNGELDIIDATTIQKYLAGLAEFSPYQKSLADVNGDNNVSIADTTQLQKILAGLA